MILKSFGCSFIFGTDLADDGRTGPWATPSNLTYPAVIAREKNMHYQCHARAGAGNFEILHRLISAIAKDASGMFIINWTWIDRFSWIDEKRITNPPLQYNPLAWQTIMPVDQFDLAKTYYKYLHSQLRDKLETLICMKNAIDLLRAHGIPFVMTWTDEILWETKWQCPDCVAWLQAQIKPYVRDFEGLSFVKWSQQNGFEISPTMHPLESAHRAAADLIVQNWDQYLCHSA